MPETSPWDSIAVPSADLNVRQVPNPTAIPCYWARDPQGACVFVVELQGDHIREFRKDQPRLNGVDVDLRSATRGTQRLILTLDRQKDLDLFAGFCRTLASVLEHAGDSAASLAVVLRHIQRWKAFMAGKAGPRLTPEEVRGLFAELTFLLEVIDKYGGQETAVRSWKGPERSHQDFIYGNSAVEIKSLVGVERSAVHISSEDQLDSPQSRLFLRIYKLSELPDAPGAMSLNDLVERISTRLTDSEAIEHWGRNLNEYRYAPLPDYNCPKFAVSGVRTFIVREGFPRLIRSVLPAGVVKVGYEIKLEAISAFECDGRTVFTEI